MLTKSRIVGGLTAAVLAVSVMSALPAGAVNPTPGWTPDANSAGGLYFYDANGHQITSGHLADSPMAAYYVGSGGLIGGLGPKAVVDTSTPVAGANSATWAGTQQWTNAQTQPHSGLPGDLAGSNLAIVAGAPTDGNFTTQQINNFPNASAVVGYQNLYEVRMYTGGAVLSNTWYSAAIEVDTVAGTWIQVYPVQTTTTLGDVPSATSIGTGTSVDLTATVSPSVTGHVSWYEGATLVSGPTAVNGSGVAVAHISPTDGSHTYTAKFSATPGSVDLPSTATNVTVQVGPIADTTATSLTVTLGAALVGVSQQLQAVVTDSTTPASTPAGTVAFYDNSSVTPVAGSFVASPAGSFTLDTTALAVGGHSIVAKFTPTNSALFAASQSTAHAFTVSSPITVPGAPRAVSGKPGIGRVTVRWAAPLSNGGAAITQYVVIATPKVGTATRYCTTTGALSCVVAGLVNGVAYRFWAQARNSAGLGPHAYSGLVVPRTIPTAPRGLKAVFPAHLRTTVSWLPPLSNGGAAIASYYVRWSTNGRIWTGWYRVGLARAVVRAGFPAGRRAWVQVFANNAAGNSPIATLAFIPVR